MKQISIVIFDHFTDVDLFLMWDILGRNKQDWRVKILGTADRHRSTHGLFVEPHGRIAEANHSDVVLFCSGKTGVKAAIEDGSFLGAFSLDPQRQLIGSICAGAFILAKLGLLDAKPATTHPDARQELETMGIRTVDQALVCNGNVATAGGCLSAVYLVGWVVETLFGPELRKKTLKEILPAGQGATFERLIDSSLRGACVINAN